VHVQECPSIVHLSEQGSAQATWLPYFNYRSLFHDCVQYSQLYAHLWSAGCL